MYYINEVQTENKYLGMQFARRFYDFLYLIFIVNTYVILGM